MAEKKTLSAKTVLEDFMNGMSDDELMTKYEISAKGLQSLIDKMIASGMLKQADVDARAQWIQSQRQPHHQIVPAVNGSSKPSQTNTSKSSPGQGTSEPSSSEANSEESRSEDITVESLFGDWHQNKKTLILLLIFVTPVGLYGLYKTSLFSKNSKIGIAILTVVVALAVIVPALKLWLAGIVGIGAYALYKILPFGKKASIATATVTGLLVLGMIVSFIEKDSGKNRTVSTTETTAPQPVQSKPVPAAPPAASRPVQVAQPVSQSKSEPKQKSTARGKTVSEIPWSEVHRKFVSKDRDLTSAQKDKLERDRKQWWNDYRDKWVRWKGSVMNVRSAGATISIDMGEGSWTQDIILHVAPESRERAAELNKNSYVTFVGRMNEQPGSTFPMDLHEVTIE